MTLAWQREQIRLSLEDILVEGVSSRAFRADLDTSAVAAMILGIAEACLLQSAAAGRRGDGGGAPPRGVAARQRGLSSIR